MKEPMNAADTRAIDLSEVAIRHADDIESMVRDLEHPATPAGTFADRFVASDSKMKGTRPAAEG
jgi:hypothetical protein